jgi:RHS repeat-associated protein
MTERDDVNGLDHTAWRKYDSYAGRWTSPDPYKGSMRGDDPQSFNRYSYVQSDPVNFIDPSGLIPGDGCIDITGHDICYEKFKFARWLQDARTSCERMADDAQDIANKILKKINLGVNSLGDAVALQTFNQMFGKITFGSYFTPYLWGVPVTSTHTRGKRNYQGQDGFAPQFFDESEMTPAHPNPDQVHHFGAYFSGGLMGHNLATNYHRAGDLDKSHMGDVRLGDQAHKLGDYIRRNPRQLENVGQLIKDTICAGKDVPE